MTSGLCPVGCNPFEILPWPDDASVVLVLDPCLIPDLGRQLFEWSSDFDKVDCLYDNTPWAPVRDVSPWAIWLTGPDDPHLRYFAEHEAPNEAGYLLFTALSHPDFGDWLRQHIQIERAPEVVELMRIGHPALAREVIGNNLIHARPGNAVFGMVLPDRTTGLWHHLALSGREPRPEHDDQVSFSPALFDAFSRFNTRRANLMIWEGLDMQTRRALGGPALPDAW